MEKRRKWGRDLQTKEKEYKLLCKEKRKEDNAR